MTIEKQPFVSYTLDEERKEKPDIFTVRLNKEERAWLDACKKSLQQAKDSSALKTLAQIGMYNVLHDDSTRYILQTVFINKKRNERTGVPIEEDYYEQK